MDKLKLNKLFFARDKLDTVIEKIQEASDIWGWGDDTYDKIDEVLNHLDEESVRVNRAILSYLAEERKENRRKHFK